MVCEFFGKRGMPDWYLDLYVHSMCRGRTLSRLALEPKMSGNFPCHSYMWRRLARAASKTRGLGVRVSEVALPPPSRRLSECGG